MSNTASRTRRSLMGSSIEWYGTYFSPRHFEESAPVQRDDLTLPLTVSCLMGGTGADLLGQSQPRVHRPWTHVSPARQKDLVRGVTARCRPILLGPGRPPWSALPD
jgi:hypothetical protein